MRKLRTVLVEDETMFRQLLLSTLDIVKNLQVIGEFGLGKPALKFCLEEKPDLVVVDLILPDIGGLEIARKLRRAAPEIKILLITAHPDEHLPAALIEIGVSGYIDKSEPVEYVIKAVDTLRRGGMFFASHVRAKSGKLLSLRGKTAPASIPLTADEQKIARLVAGGMGSKEIAASLKLTVNTVERNRAVIMQKIGVQEVASLTRWCIRAGLMDVDEA